MPWWAAIGGLVGAVQVYAGLTLVHKVGAGPFVSFTITAALIMSLLLDHFGLVSHAGAHDQSGENRRRAPYGWRNLSDHEVLEGSQDHERFMVTLWRPAHCRLG
jgi:hypothetical protein